MEVEVEKLRLIKEGKGVVSSKVRGSRYIYTEFKFETC